MTPPGSDRHWFEPVADHLGAAYLRYSFTKGTEQEVAFLVEVLGLEAGMRVLDVGCGPGRHAHALARRGMRVVGVDISERFVELARASAPPLAEFVRADARALDYDAEFDAAISLCQGAFGLVGAGPDLDVLAGIARAMRPGGRAAVSAFNAYFAVKYHTDAEFDAATGTAHEVTEVRNERGEPDDVDLWTTCYTPRELQLLAERAGLETEAVWSVEPGRYERAEPTTESPEFLLLGVRCR
ncbi:MAG: SAM-dependent methyltransferase [Acidimicrobiales bacterium]